MSITFKISNLDRDTDSGFVHVVHWNAIQVDGDYTASIYSTANFTKQDSINYVPYSELTEAAVIEWVKASLGAEGVTAVETALAANIAEQKAPKVASGTPWTA